MKFSCGFARFFAWFFGFSAPSIEDVGSLLLVLELLVDDDFDGDINDTVLAAS